MPYFPADFEDLELDDSRRSKKIEYLGSKALILLPALQLYYHTGCGFHAGCESLRDVARWLELRQWQGDYPASLSCSLSSVQRAAALTEEFFQCHFALRVRPQLFVRLGRGMSFAGLTELGWVAWRLDEDYLRGLGLLD